MIKKFTILFCFLILLYSCSNQAPKPYGYYRIDLPEHHYKRFTGYPDFNFDLSLYANVESVIDTVKGEWFNINYPAFNAKIYCSYFLIKPFHLNTFLEDNHKLVYRHVMKADAITEQSFSDPEKRVYGVLYHIEGNVATPLQFVLTDSTAHFFRASLLFDAAPNQDSIAPVLNYIKKDVRQLIESFEW
ncbi:MAG: gliding motility lipoprotein GldD [Candidatus Azobacteroides sp.]|nr:gliding motility lipoprotein GldD [Candidatus Azobacteroides sp.]